MAKVTSKLQVTIPKALAERYRIKPGDEIEWEAAGPYIRVVPGQRSQLLPLEERLRIFDLATQRQEERQANQDWPDGSKYQERGWTREELYDRGNPR